MSEETTATESTTETQGTTETVATPETTDVNISDIVAEEKAKRESKEPEAEKVEEPKSETSETKKKSATERKEQLSKEIQDLVSEKNEIKNEVGTLKAELAEIKTKFQGGEITQRNAEIETQKAEDAFREAIAEIKVSDDLEPYKEEIAKVALSIAKQFTEPLKNQLQMLSEERDRELNERRTKAEQEYLNKSMENYNKQVKAYPHLFDKPQKEGEQPDMKPEYYEEAMKIAKRHEKTYVDEEGKEMTYTTMFTDEGLDDLFVLLNRNIERAENAKSEIAMQEKIKRTRVESPESKGGTPKPQGILDIVEEELLKRR